MAQDELYQQAVSGHGPALERLARAYEADPDRRRDLLQEIHLAVWRSLGRFDGRCSLRTWVYRVAHNVAASHVRRAKARVLVPLEEIELPADAERNTLIEQLYALIERLKPLDRELILLWLEGADAASIGEITGISPGNVATKLHRIRKLLARNAQ